MSIAEKIVNSANELFAERAESEHADDWGDHEAHERFVNVLRSGAAWVTGPRSVAASVSNTSSGRLWGYVASEVLDSASSNVELPESAFILSISSTLYVLAW